ncbi:hypothetical protein Tco_0471907 [Tanacetum coccineum]
MSSDNASSAVTYTSISSYTNGPSWGIPLVNAGELSEMDPYEEVSQQGQAPPLSPAYVPDPMELDEHVPVKDHPYADDASPTTESPRYIADSDSMEGDFIDYPDEPEDDEEDPEEDPSEEHKPEDEDTEEEEPSEGSNETEPFEDDETDVTPPPPGHHEARIYIRPQTPMAASTQTLIVAFAAGSPSFPLPPTCPTYDQAPLFDVTLTDPSAVPVVDPVPSAGDTEAFETDESTPTPRSPQTRVLFS